MTRVSNNVYVTVLDPIPRENIGWWLEVYDFATDSMLARIYSYLDFSFSVPTSDTGAFEIDMSDYDPLFTSTLPNGQPGTYLLDGGPHYVRFIDEGVERQRGVITKHTLGRVSQDGTRPRAISGKGLAVLLDWAIVLPTSIGASTSGNRNFTAKSWAYVWTTLWDEAVAAGRAPAWIRPTFTATTDSRATAWGDSGNYEIPMGQSMLDLLQAFCEQHGFEWRMMPNGVLEAAPALGNDLSGTVRFFEHDAISTAEDTTDGTDLRTHVYVLGGDNMVTLASDSGAAYTWGHREKWVNQSSAKDSGSRSAVANTLLALAKTPLRSRTFKVPFDPRHPDTWATTHRRAFVDYQPGSTVGYGPRAEDGSTDYRIVEMAVKVDPNKTELEITVMSRIQREVDRLSKLLARILAGQTGVAGSGGSGVGSVSSAVIAAAIRLGDLLNVHVGAAVAKDTLVFDGSNWNAGRSALDDLSDVDVSTATDGQVLKRSGGIWVGGTGGGGGGSGDGWKQIVDDPLTTLANMTSVSGTWVVGTGCIQQTDAGAASRGLRTTAKIARPDLIAEVEMRYDTGSGLNRFGIAVGSGSMDDAAAVAYLTGNGSTSWTVSTERQGITALTSGDAVTYTSGTWVKMRIIVSGSTMTVFVNDVYVASTSTGGWATRMDYVRLYTYQAAASFRNLKVWRPLDPSEAGVSSGDIGDRRWVRGSTAHAMDDEFNDGALSGSWIAVHGNGSSSNVTWTEGGDSLSARMVGGDGNGSPNQYLHCQLKAYALAVGESIQTFLSASNPTIQYPLQGLVISDSGTDGSGTQYMWCTVWDLANERFGSSVGANFRTRSAFTDIAGKWFAGVHMKMTRSATLTYDLYSSSDGVSWGSKYGTLTAAGGYTPTHVGLFVSGLVFGSPSVAQAGFDYFRVT